MSIGIYKYENKLNGHIYIGQSQNIEKRYQQHLYDAKNRPERGSGVDVAIRKYGIENFSFEILELCSLEDLDKREQYWIQRYDSYNTGYNRTIGGSALRGEDHPRAILTEQDVWNLREEYRKGTRRKDAFAPYIEQGITQRCLLKVWNGETWLGIHMEVYTPENKAFHKQQVDHREDNLGKSSLDRAIPQEEIDLWVQEYNNGNSINAIAKKYGKDNGTVEKYIHNPKAISEVKYHGRTVKNLETNKIFNSISAAARWAGCGATTLTRHLSTDCTAGKVPNSDQPAHWIELS